MNNDANLISLLLQRFNGFLLDASLTVAMGRTLLVRHADLTISDKSVNLYLTNFTLFAIYLQLYAERVGGVFFLVSISSISILCFAVSKALV